MIRYVNYIDAIGAPEGLLARIMSQRPGKKPFPIYRVAGIAAALALAVGSGVWAAGRQNPVEPVKELGQSEPWLESGGPNTIDPGRTPLGSYDIVAGENVTHYAYPRLNMADGSGFPQNAPNYWLGAWDGSEREVTAEDLDHLLGERFLEHLGLPEDASVSGTLYFTADRTPCGADIFIDAGDRSVYIEELAGSPVPSCVEPGDDLYGHTLYHGTDVRALTDWYSEDSCEVSFLLNGTGWKATVRGENYEELSSRFVRLAVDDLNAGLKAAQWEYAPLPEVPAGDSGDTITPAYDPNR